MKRTLIVFLQAVVVLVGIGAATFLLWEPYLEGVNANATTLYEIYFDDPFLAYVYVASIAFFVALYQAFRFLGYVGRGEVFSERAVNALRTIKRSTMALVVFILGAEAYFFVVQRGRGEDIAGGVMMGLVMIFISVVVVTAAAVFEKILQSAVDMRSVNNLTA